MNEDMLEIMIGKYLDGQITPNEKRLLEAELDNNLQSRELFEQLQDLHQRTREVIVTEVLRRGKDVKDIFEKAWGQQSSPLSYIRRMSGQMRFITGVAAGLVIGLTLHFVLRTDSTQPVNPTPTKVVVQSPGLPDSGGVPLPLQSGNMQNVNRNVEWYTFTDENGNQWLVEGLRQNTVKTAAFQEIL